MKVYIAGKITGDPDYGAKFKRAARDRLFQLSMPMWVENGRIFHE